MNYKSIYYPYTIRVYIFIKPVFVEISNSMDRSRDILYVNCRLNYYSFNLICTSKSNYRKIGKHFKFLLYCIIKTLIFKF